MNVNKLNELCDKFIILIDKNSNNLTGGVSEINHPKIMIHYRDKLTVLSWSE